MGMGCWNMFPFSFVSFLPTLYRDYIESGGSMIYELERIRKKVVVAQLRYYPGIFLVGLNKTTSIFQYNLYLERDLNEAPPEYKS
jgi:hypothetical protein